MYYWKCDLLFIGTLWFMFVTKVNLSASLMMCVVPFIPGDLIKIVLAYCLSKKIKVKHLNDVELSSPLKDQEKKQFVMELKLYRIKN